MNKSLSSLSSFRMFPELSSTDMVVVIVKGMNLPAPNGKTKFLPWFYVDQCTISLFGLSCYCTYTTKIVFSYPLKWRLCFDDVSNRNNVCGDLSPPGIHPNDLDAYIKFDFLYPSSVRAACFQSLMVYTSDCCCNRLVLFPFTRSSHRDTKLPSSRTPTPLVRCRLLSVSALCQKPCIIHT